ncbi:MAG: adenosylcobinamide-GDP ribazoletransferase [Firmicutes bacterium]|nr:adenosylcobinamide-GDP ribazoletransferase [Bacillota bacterium]
MKLITGFFMAWGNFLTLPCPLKLWDSNLKNYMLGFLPSVGLIIGLIWGGACILLMMLNIPFLVMAFLMTFIPFGLCGFLHLDGFMDCCDAIMSRRPLEDRQRILKDSHTGAFAVVSLAFLLLGYYAFMSQALSMGVDFFSLCLIPVVSRGVSGMNVLLRTPMGTSQYAHGGGASADGQKKKAVLIIVIQLALYCGTGLLLTGAPSDAAIVLGAVALGALIAIIYGKRQLGGMNGDIAGYGIVWGELLGVLAMALV